MSNHVWVWRFWTRLESMQFWFKQWCNLRTKNNSLYENCSHWRQVNNTIQSQKKLMKWAGKVEIDINWMKQNHQIHVATELKNSILKTHKVAKNRALFHKALQLIIRSISIVAQWQMVYWENLQLITTLCETGPWSFTCDILFRPIFHVTYVTH